MKKISNIYDRYINFENVEDVWNVVKKTCKNKEGIFKFSLNKNLNIQNICDILKSRNYKPLPFRLFMIFEPKERLVMSQCVVDKIVNHFIVKYYLSPYLENKLIDSNVATRKGKGSEYANKLIIRYINKIRLTNKTIYALKVDISKYFYSIDHKILIQKLKKDIDDDDVINIIKSIIDETNKPYINKVISIFNRKYNTDIPLYKKDVGLSIGAMTSQFLAIYFLNDLDHYIKEKLNCKYYLRYMDDFLILDTDIERLKFVYKEIEKKIIELNLNINPKSNIYNLKNGVDFLGFRYISDNKFKIKYRKNTLRKIEKKLNHLYCHDLLRYYKSYGSYYGYLSKLKRVERNFKMKTVEKFNYYKEKHPNQIVFVKEGSFYKTFGDDALIVWNIFDYKINNNSIGFGIRTKVFDELSKKDLGYLIIDDKETLIKGNDEVISKNVDAFDKIVKYLNSFISSNDE